MAQATAPILDSTFSDMPVAVRLHQPHPLGLIPTFSATLTTIAFDDSSLRWLETRT